MFHKISSVRACPPHKLRVVFDCGTVKEYDVGILIESNPEFFGLGNNYDLFECIRVDPGGYGISWNDETDIASEELWENGVSIV